MPKISLFFDGMIILEVLGLGDLKGAVFRSRKYLENVLL